MATSKGKVFSNLIWRFLEKTGAQLVTFCLMLVLARILDKKDFGMATIIGVLSSIFSVFVSYGLGNSLIQKKDADAIDYSTVFYANCVLCGLLYIILFFTAPFISDLYNRPELTNMIRVSGITILVSGVKNIQQAYVSKHLLFKVFFKSTLIGTICSAVVGVVMALSGFGVWSLVMQPLVNNIIDTIMLWIFVKWRPQRLFDFLRLKKLFSYGWKLSLSIFINTAYEKIRALIIGKIYSPTDLALFEQGGLFPNTVVGNVDESINSVMFPVLSETQNDLSVVKSITRKSIKVSVFCIAPLVMGLAGAAEQIVNVFLTDKWIDCVPFMRIFCIIYMFFPIHTSNQNATKAIGRSDIILYLEFVKKIINVITILICMHYSVLVMAVSLLVTDFMAQIINSEPNRRMLGYGYLEQLKDIMPCILLASAMGGIVYLLGFLPLNDIALLFIQIPAGALIYIGTSYLFKIDQLFYLKDIIIDLIEAKK